MFIQWTEDRTLSITSLQGESEEDYETDDVEVKALTTDEVDFSDNRQSSVDMQFGDGSVTFNIPKSAFINITELWKSLGDVPIDENDCIDTPWNGFIKGVHREAIWHWFEDVFNVSVAKDLMGMEKETIRVEKELLVDLIRSYYHGMGASVFQEKMKELKKIVGE